jgi:DNA-binding PadR family transcriptional regulator
MTIAELALLSLIVEEPRHGYGIRAVINERGMREWVDLGTSSIYHVLKRLEDKGLVEGRPGTDSSGPSRTVYHPTAAGRKALSTGIRRALTELHRTGSPFLLGLANLTLLPAREVQSALERRAVALQGESERLKEIKRRLAEAPHHVLAMFEYTAALISAELGWLEAFIEEMP